MMDKVKRFSIPLAYKNQVESLFWEKDYLVDHSRTKSSFHLNGEIVSGHINYAYKFDAAITILDGTYTVIYERLGTKGLILKGDKIVREINRSYYCADAYEYPVALFHSGGDVYVAHCPDEYNVIEIENIEGGRLTKKDRTDRDFFHSRLQISPDQRWLLSAGWVWHPFDHIELYDLSSGLADPKVIGDWRGTALDNSSIFEINNAVFLSSSQMLLSGNTQNVNPEEAVLMAYDFVEDRIISEARLQGPTGKLMPVGTDHVVTFFKHPRLLEIYSGRMLREWPDISTDEQNSSISHHLNHIPVALDPGNERFAVVTPETIEVVGLG